MAAAVLGLVVPGIEVAGAATVGKTFPGFMELWASMLEHVSTPPIARDLDEDDVRVRPGRGSRPRTRRRPAHEDAIEGFVAAVERGRYGILVADRMVTAMRARELGRRGVVVGDRVALAGDTSGAPGTLARAGPGVTPGPPCCGARRTTSTRWNGSSANADQIGHRAALADPPPRPRFIDRCLVAGFSTTAGPSLLLCLTKADLAPGRRHPVIAYSPLGIPHAVLGRPPTEGPASKPLRHHLADLDQRSSPASRAWGKSTLVNALIPDADRAVGKVSAAYWA